jgi:hypothetical protein
LRSGESPFLDFVDYNEPIFPQKKLSKKEKEIIANADIIIHLDGIENRIFDFPIQTARYSKLTSINNDLFYVRTIDGKHTLLKFDFDKMEETEIGEYRDYVISPDGKNVMFRQGTNNFYLNKLTEKFNTKTGKIDLSNLSVNLNQKEE